MAHIMIESKHENFMKQDLSVKKSVTKTSTNDTILTQQTEQDHRIPWCDFFGKAKMIRSFCALCMLFFLVFALPGISTAQLPNVNAEDDKDNIDGTNFTLVPRGNYYKTYWIIRIKDSEIIGYSPWDVEKRRWNLFNLYGQYRGYIQATLGDRSIEYYKQYLWYDRNNRYLGVFIATIGGHPKTKDYKEGELGGSLDLYRFGNIPLPPYQLMFDIDPNKSYRPMGLDSSIVPRLPRGR